MNLEILPSAWNDLAEGYWFYERQSSGLGSYFRESLINDIEALHANGGVHRRIFGWHRLLARRFPFAVYYSVAGQTVTVRAVLDCRRDPRWTRRKLQ